MSRQFYSKTFSKCTGMGQLLIPLASGACISRGSLTHAASRSRPLWATGLKPGLGMAGGQGRREAAAGGSEIASAALPGPLPPHLCCVRWQRWEQGERGPQGRSRQCWIWPGAGAARWEEDVAEPLTGSPLPFLPALCFQKRTFAFY